MAEDQLLSYATAAVIGGLVLSQVFRKGFDPFAPVWLFLAGYTQIYVVQAIMYREWAVRVRGAELVAAANGRALWALLWFLAVYYSNIGKFVAAKLPGAPRHWSPGLIAGIAPPMIIWGLACSGIMLAQRDDASAEENLLRQFPIFMLIAGVLLIVTGRQPDNPRPALAWSGVAIAAGYSLIWMFNGKRSHSLIGVLTGVCAFYAPRGRRPSLPVLAATGLACALSVGLAIGWRGNRNYERSPAGFVQYVAEFNVDTMLISMNVKDGDESAGYVKEKASKETEEYGGFLLMMDTVPLKAAYDYGESYMRLISTYIPRFLWPDKPFYGRQQWVNAWIAGSEFPRDATFTGPAIGILGATQLNGGAVGTLVVLGVLGLLTRTSYEYYRRHATCPWAQAWWAMTYYNSWLMTANDDPFVWFYYIYGHTTLPPFACLWLYHRLAAPQAATAGWAPAGAVGVC